MKPRDKRKEKKIKNNKDIKKLEIIQKRYRKPNYDNVKRLSYKRIIEIIYY